MPHRPSLPPFEVRAGRVDVAVPVLAYEVALAWPIARVSASERAALDLVGLILTAPGELLGRSPFTPETVQQVDFWSSYSRDGSSVRLWATFDRPENLQTVLTAVHLALSHLTTKLTDGDVQRLRRRWADARTLALGDVRVRAAMLARAVATGTIPDAQYDWDFGEHDRLTAVDIRGAAARLVPDARAVLVVAYPDEAAPIRGMVFRRIDEEAPSE